MPFRARVKRVFGRAGSGGEADGFSKASSRKSSSFYQPGDVMPAPKYRAPVDKKHKAHLESFSFGDNQRRTSTHSVYSPMGSKWPSRNPSIDGGWTGCGRRHPTPGAMTNLHSADDYSDASDRKESIESKSAPQHLEHADPETSQLPTSYNANASDHRPFSMEDLHQALERSTSRGQPAMVTVT